MLVVIIGVSVLALDGARFMYLQTQLQNGADALAFPAAAQLDRMPTAVERASNAISKFSDGSNGNVQVAEVKFLSSLPARDSDPILPTHITSDPTRAAFVEVTVAPVTMPTILPASIFGGANALTAGGKKVARVVQGGGDFTSIYIFIFF